MGHEPLYKEKISTQLIVSRLVVLYGAIDVIRTGELLFTQKNNAVLRGPRKFNQQLHAVKNSH